MTTLLSSLYANCAFLAGVGLLFGLGGDCRMR